jgi:hypothetical protein
VATGALPAGWAVEDGVGALFTGGLLSDVVSRVPEAQLYRVEAGPDGEAREQALSCRLLTRSDT